MLLAPDGAFPIHFPAILLQMSAAYKRALSRILKDPNSPFSADELAEVAGVSPRTIYAVADVRNDSAHLRADAAEKLGQYLDECNERRFSKCFSHRTSELITPQEGSADGDHRDEVYAITLAVAQWALAMEDGDPDRIKVTERRLIELHGRVRAESHQRMGADL